MLTEPVYEVSRRAKKLLAMLKSERFEGVILSMKEGFSMAGGGSLPTQTIPTVLIRIVSKRLSPAVLEYRLRHLDVPIIARIAEEEVLFDLRTIGEGEYSFIRKGLKQAVSS
jgi:L-seryl-tRNA(Ser) seleniumtransferase